MLVPFDVHDTRSMDMRTPCSLSKTFIYYHHGSYYIPHFKSKASDSVRLVCHLTTLCYKVAGRFVMAILKTISLYLKV